MELAPEQMREALVEAGATDVDEAAAEEFAELLENYIGYISEEAVALADEEDRSAVTGEDILQAEK